jgi:hypothetical protein
MIKAIVKGNSLDCYGWDHEDEIVVFEKINNLDADNGYFLFDAYNVTKDVAGAVVNDQIIFIDDPTELLKSDPVYDDTFKIISGDGGFYIGLK